MKDKNLPDDNNSQTLDELTKDINQIIETVREGKRSSKFFRQLSKINKTK